MAVPPKLPLRSVLVLPFLLQILAAVSLIGWLSLRSGEDAINQLAVRFLGEVNQRVQQRLDDYLTVSTQISQVNQALIQQGQLNPADSSEVKQHLQLQLLLYPNVALMGYGLNDGRFLGMQQPVGQRVNLLTQADLPPQLAEQIQQDIRLPSTPKKRNLRIRAVGGKIVLSTITELYGAQGQPLGISRVDLKLATVSRFLQSLEQSKSRRIFVIERSGLLIADSTGASPVKLVKDSVQRLSAANSSDGLIQATTGALIQSLEDFANIQDQTNLEVQIEDRRYFISVAPWSDTPELNWLVVVVVPTQEFMAEIHANTRTTMVLALMALLIATILGFYTSRWIAIPIRRLSLASYAIASGNLHQRLAPSFIRELNLLSRSFNDMARQLRESFDFLHYQAQHDNLTGLLNRSALNQQLKQAIARQQALTGNQSDHPVSEPDAVPEQFAVLFLDLDYFKLVNDSLGHFMGDYLLTEVAQRLEACVRETDALARFGGDEFVILLWPLKDVTEATEVAVQIDRALQRPFDLNGNEVFVGASIGIAMNTLDTQTPDSLLRNADSALYQAKMHGKQRYEIFDDQMHTTVVQRLQLETDLRRAIERQELLVFYQPIIDLKRQTIQGFEALLRWNHPIHGMISPEDFIPIAEETGLILRLGTWVLQTACSQMQTWQEAFAQCRTMTISVNLSGKQFLQPDLVAQIHQALSQAQLSASYLKLEITESLLLHDEVSVQKKLRDIRDLGVRLIVDDFGTGYSALSYLYQLPISSLKIDRTFIEHIGQPTPNSAIVDIIVQLAHRLDLDVVAEGVEQQQQFDYLNHIGCDAIQGYLLSQALPGAEITQQLAAGNLSSQLYPKSTQP